MGKGMGWDEFGRMAATNYKQGADNEVEAYSVQYDTGLGGFPTSNPLNSIYGVNYSWLGSIENDKGEHLIKN